MPSRSETASAVRKAVMQGPRTVVPIKNLATQWGRDWVDMIEDLTAIEPDAFDAQYIELTPVHALTWADWIQGDWGSVLVETDGWLLSTNDDLLMGLDLLRGVSVIVDCHPQDLAAHDLALLSVTTMTRRWKGSRIDQTRTNDRRVSLLDSPLPLLHELSRLMTEGKS